MSFRADKRDGKHVVINQETDLAVAFCDNENHAKWNARYFTLRNQGLSYAQAIKKMDEEGLKWD